MVLPNYLEDYVRNNENVVPGQGMAKYNQFYLKRVLWIFITLLAT